LDTQRNGDPTQVQQRLTKCALCNNNGMYRCSYCKTIYCSEKCQKDDWTLRNHRQKCSYKEQHSHITFGDGLTFVDVTDKDSTLRTREGITFKVPFNLSDKLFGFLNRVLPSLIESNDNQRKPWYGEMDLKIFSKILVVARKHFGEYCDEVFEHCVVPYIIKECENYMWKKQCILEKQEKLEKQQYNVNAELLKSRAV
jgi:hypothetical protein